MRITSKGQVTIPQAVRAATGMLPNTEVDFVIDDGYVRLVKASTETRRGRGAAALGRLRDHGRKVRMTTDEIIALTRGEE